MGQGRHQEGTAGRDQLVAQRGQVRVVADGHGEPCVDRTRVEPFLDLHQTDTRLPIAGQQRPLDRRRTAPAGQQREVQVDHRDTFEQRDRNDAPVRHDDGQLDPGFGHILHGVRNREAELEGGGLHRARCDRAPPAPPPVRPGHAQCDVMPGVDQRPQGGTAISGVPRKASRAIPVTVEQ